MKKTINKQIRDAISNEYPGLADNEDLWRLLAYMAWGIKEAITLRPLVDQETLARIERKLPALYGNNYCGLTLLERMREVLGEEFTWTDYAFTESKARTIIFKFPPHIQALIDTEVYSMSDDRVYIDTGLKYSRRSKDRDKLLMEQEARITFNFAAPEAKPILEYMNELPTNLVTKLVYEKEGVYSENWKNALAYVMDIDDELVRESQLITLQNIRDELKAYYKPSWQGNTSRIFPANLSIPMLMKDVRKILTKGWWEMDLNNSQLSIVAVLWDIPEVQDFLAAKGKIWNELFKHFGMDAEDLKVNNRKWYEGAKREVFKESLYGLIYGMSISNLVKRMNASLQRYGIKGDAKHFLSHPIIKALHEARNKKMKEMLASGSVKTIFGKEIKVPEGKAKEKLRAIRSMLAQEAQAVEMYLLLPVIELASKTDDFLITVWQHDGFSVSFKREARRERNIRKIQQLVQERADQLGIITYLEVEQL
ncbi:MULTISPECIES: hypothetical protein [Calothrix]|uniref:DNA polymerase I n=2 Tax=Calothrix TaxID=1186 RepID=A0ABR8AK63_9CYAN|nr:MULTISPECIES: hypothetical protein [Calothrix]MBD2200169.1 hypothetical protein [Calothrix parietina FACHB-288]MBD2229121.1 hypothetical protein [Calothrix anomala FACHB-343]